MMKYLLLLPIFLILMSCEDKSGNMPLVGDHTIKVLLDEDMDEQRNSFLQTIASIDIVPLELDSTFLSQYSQMRVTDNGIYIFSSQANELYVYSRTGQKIATISNFGDAPGHYVNVENFSLLSDSTIVMYDGAKANMLFFTKEGKFISEKKMKYAAANNLACVNDSLLVLYTKSLTFFDSDKNAFRFIDTQGHVKKTSSRLPMWARKNIMGQAGGTPFSFYGSNVLWFQQFAPHVYSFVSDSVYCKYSLDFGKHNIPESFYIDHEKDFGDVSIINVLKDLDEGGFASSIELFQENDNYVYFQYMFRGLIHFALWDKRVQRCYTISSYELGDLSILVGGFLCSYQNSFYLMLGVSNMKMVIEAKDRIKDERILSLLQQFEDYQKKVHLEEDDYILLSIKMK